MPITVATPARPQIRAACRAVALPHRLRPFVPLDRPFAEDAITRYIFISLLTWVPRVPTIRENADDLPAACSDVGEDVVPPIDGRGAITERHLPFLRVRVQPYGQPPVLEASDHQSPRHLH
jgi:hypothetical protein